MFLNLIRSCWAFAGSAAVDAAFKIQKNRTVATSQQELVDCFEGGCQGGGPEFRRRIFFSIKVNFSKTSGIHLWFKPYFKLSCMQLEMVLKMKMIILIHLEALSKELENDI